MKLKNESHITNVCIPDSIILILNTLCVWGPILETTKGTHHVVNHFSSI